MVGLVEGKELQLPTQRNKFDSSKLVLELNLDPVTTETHCYVALQDKLGKDATRSSASVPFIYSTLHAPSILNSSSHGHPTNPDS